VKRRYFFLLFLYCQLLRVTAKWGGTKMFWDFLLFVIIGPLVGFFVYYLSEDKKRTEKFTDQLRSESRLVY